MVFVIANNKPKRILTASYIMDLFNNSSTYNLLPYDGETIYYGHLLNKEQSQTYYNILLQNTHWKNDEAIILGKRILTKRKVAWYGEAPFTYTYSNVSKLALPWTPGLLNLKQLVENKTGELFNSCLLNLYHNGSEGMTWHSDNEKDLKTDGAIASLSLGAERKFLLKHKSSKQTVSLILERGSLLVMKGTTQTHWLHSVPLTKKSTTPRINLTFRQIVTRNHEK